EFEGLPRFHRAFNSYRMADRLLTQPGVATSTLLTRPLLEEMQSRETSTEPAMPASVSPASRDQWAWLDAVGRSLTCGFLLVDSQRTPGPAIGAGHIVEALRTLAEWPDSGLLGPLSKSLESDRPQSATLGALNLVCRRLNVQGETVGAIVIASQGPARPETIEPWVTAAAEAHLGQKAPDDPEEAFDRIASLHRLLHDGVEGGDEREAVTAFAEALFAWDGIESM